MAAPVHRLTRAAFFFATYGVLASLSLWFAYELRFAGPEILSGVEGSAAEAYLYVQRPLVLLWLIPLKVLLLWAWGQFRGVFYYFRLPDALRMVMALVMASAFAVVLSLSLPGLAPTDAFGIPRGVALVDLNLSLVFFIGLRVSIRALRERFGIMGSANTGIVERVAIVGAGRDGALLAADLLSRRGHGIEPVCFLDDDVAKHSLYIHGIPVIGAPERIPELAEKYRVTEIILALPASAVRRIREVSALASASHQRVLVVPSISDLAGGRVRASDLRPISVEDILGREPANLDGVAIADLIKGRVILVTGAGGSIGLELCRQVAACSPARLLLLDQCEVLLYQAEQELVAAGAGALITPLVADVTDLHRMTEIFQRYRPSLIFHAAAHKHVPMMEAMPSEALKNNVNGTWVVAHLAAKHGADKFVLISSDKAVNPTNVMGATKRLAERMIHSIQAHEGAQTRFMAVRFGNVLGSSGSVVPIFRRQIAAGGPVTVTHPEVKRYFMTIPEAVGLVLQSATLGDAGDILVLEMGQPLKIIDVARQLIELSGLRPETDIEIRITGLRPGEKLVEELLCAGEEFRPTKHPRVFRFMASSSANPPPADLLAQVAELVRMDAAACKQGIRKLVPEYVPFVE